MTAVPADLHVGLGTYTLLEDGIVKGSIISNVIEFFDPTGGLPVAPTNGDRYISSATANGWTLDTIQFWNGVEWIEIVPSEGELTYVVGGGTFPATAILWNGVAWGAFGGGAGDVLGPGASTDNAVVRWNGATGTLVENSTVTISDTGDVVVPGALQMPVGEPVGTTNVLSVTTTAGVPTDLTVNSGSLVYDTAGSTMYIFNGAAWDAFAPSGTVTNESVNYPGGAVGVVNIGVTTTFATTSGAGLAQANIANGTTVGQQKNIVMSAYVVNLQVNFTNGIDASGAAFTTITYTSAGQGTSLTWDGTNWIILNTGGVVA